LVGYWKRGVFPRRKGSNCHFCDQKLACGLVDRRVCLWSE